MILYDIKQSELNEIGKLKDYKLSTIFAYAKNLPKDEVNKIRRYVNKTVPLDLKNYKSIYINKEMVGCLLVKPFKNGQIIDEIFIEEKIRNNGVGTDIIKKLLKEFEILYLYVYKENTKAFNLYKKLKFNILEETETRYLMLYRNS